MQLVGENLLRAFVVSPLKWAAVAFVVDIGICVLQSTRPIAVPALIMVQSVAAGRVRTAAASAELFFTTNARATRYRAAKAIFDHEARVLKEAAVFISLELSVCCVAAVALRNNSPFRLWALYRSLEMHNFQSIMNLPDALMAVAFCHRVVLPYETAVAMQGSVLASPEALVLHVLPYIVRYEATRAYKASPPPPRRKAIARAVLVMGVRVGCVYVAAARAPFALQERWPGWTKLVDGRRGPAYVGALAVLLLTSFV